MSTERPVVDLLGALARSIEQARAERRKPSSLPPCEGRCGLPGGCGHWSDCAQHNEPAMPNGPCDCQGER